MALCDDAAHCRIVVWPCLQTIRASSLNEQRVPVLGRISRFLAKNLGYFLLTIIIVYF
jgi:hypothetical protein